MKTLWITYSWKDNENGDIDYLAQELEKSGITIKMDKWNIQGGKRLWEQIDKFITDENESDGWAIIATQNSLGSEPCKEEIAYALERALGKRGKDFPVIGIFQGHVADDLIPSAIKTRLFVSTQDDNWIERIKSSLENLKPNIPKFEMEPFSYIIHQNCIEVRPRVGSWVPFFAAIPLSEKESVNPHILRGAKGIVPTGGMLTNCGEYDMNDQGVHVMYAGDEATPSMSYYVFYKQLPSRLHFGSQNGKQFLIHLAKA
jgi:hypothetical protein